jgi:CheY-like chemotaxis protein
MMQATPRLTDARIMVVDDERVNVVLLERILEQDGYRNVKSVTDPSEAIGLYDQFEPDLVLLDLHMPKLDGFAVMKLLEDRISSDTFLPILILTADIRPEIKRRALSAGAKDFVTKPFDRTEVLLRIQNLLETRFLHLRMRQDAVPEGQAT